MEISAPDCNMGIYDDKVSYLTLEPGKEMAIIIQDKEISALQRHLFEELYNRDSKVPFYLRRNEDEWTNI